MAKEYGIRNHYESAAEKLWGEYRGLALAFLQRFFESKPQNLPG